MAEQPNKLVSQWVGKSSHNGQSTGTIGNLVFQIRSGGGGEEEDATADGMLMNSAMGCTQIVLEADDWRSRGDRETAPGEDRLWKHLNGNVNDKSSQGF